MYNSKYDSIYESYTDLVTEITTATSVIEYQVGIVEKNRLSQL